MTRAELLAALTASQAQMTTALQGLTPEQLAQPGVVGEWSVKDVLAHLTACEVEMVTNLSKARRGQTPKVTSGAAAIEKQNAQWFRDYQHRPLERVLADYHGVRKQTLKLVEASQDADLNAPLKWLKNEPLWKYIEGEAYGHEAEHAAQVGAWRKEKGF